MRKEGYCIIKIIRKVAGYVIPYRVYLYLGENKSKIKKMLGFDKNKETIGSYWSNYYSEIKTKKLSWWESDLAKRHINMLVNNVDSPVVSEGLNQLLIKRLNGMRLKQGISVGCGTASKELRLLQMDIVEKFILFELSEEAVKVGKNQAKELNLENRVEFRVEDAFKYNFNNMKIDLVHWNNSLHHMLDVPAAVKWSYDILSPGGIFYMDDFVGSSRFQYPRYILDIINEIRDALLHKYLKSPFQDGQYLGCFTNPNPDDLWRDDPSEAADSDKILKSVKHYFPQAEIILTGGIVYFLALGGLWGNFDEENEEDIFVLKQLMERDKQYALCSDVMSPYAVALANK